MPLQLKSAPTKSFADTAQADVAERVGTIVAAVRREGDDAVRRYAEQFDGWTRPSRLDDDQVEEIVAGLDPQVIEDIRFVQDQVRTFAQAQRDSLVDLEVETLPGVRLGQKHVPVQAVGAYVPGEVPADGVRAHDDRHRQGGGRAPRRGLHPTHPG